MMNSEKNLESTGESSVALISCAREKKEVNIYELNSSNQYNIELGIFFDKFMFDSFNMPTELPQNSRSGKKERSRSKKTSKVMKKFVPKPTKKM